MGPQEDPGHRPRPQGGHGAFVIGRPRRNEGLGEFQLGRVSLGFVFMCVWAQGLGAARADPPWAPWATGSRALGVRVLVVRRPSSGCILTAPLQTLGAGGVVGT